MISRRTTLCGAVALTMAAIPTGASAYALADLRRSRRDRLTPLLNTYQQLFIELNALNGFATVAAVLHLTPNSRTAAGLFVHSTTLYVPDHPIGFYAKRYDQVLNASADRLDRDYVAGVPELAEVAQKLSELRDTVADLRTRYHITASSVGDQSAGAFQAYEGEVHALSKRIDRLLVEQEQLRRSAYHAAELPLLDALTEARDARAAGRLPNVALEVSPRLAGSETKSDAHAYLFSRFSKAGDAILAYIG